MPGANDGGTRLRLEGDGLGALFAALRAEGYTVVGPTVRDGAIVYDALEGPDELPAGVTDVQGPGQYRLERRADGARFGYAVGPHSWKKYVLPPTLRLWTARRAGSSFTVEEDAAEPPRLALIGVRACELQAIAVQDRALLGGPHTDPHYAARRQRLFIVGVSCGQAAGTCFCTSMGTGPRVTRGHDLALTEVVGEGPPAYVVEVGSPEGARILARVPHRPCDAPTARAADEVVERTARSMGRRLDTDGLKELLARNLEHPRWAEVADRCLGCANCTMVCPTCFCTTVEDVADLRGETAERVRRWDSCFTMDFSHVHGGSVRATTRARYRQWLTHKLSSWFDQFGTSGCVGCGRCIAWCPVGIDLTEEAAAIRASDGAGLARKETSP